VFGTEAVPVRGEGAALGAAIHAAWVWFREEGSDRTLAQLSAPFVILDEAARRKPDPGGTEVYRHLRRLFRSLSNRIRGRKGEDPFELRRRLLEILPRQAESDSPGEDRRGTVHGPK
jgi:xylulokinase